MGAKLAELAKMTGLQLSPWELHAMHAAYAMREMRASAG